MQGEQKGLAVGNLCVRAAAGGSSQTLCPALGEASLPCRSLCHFLSQFSHGFWMVLPPQGCWQGHFQLWEQWGGCALGRSTSPGQQAVPGHSAGHGAEQSRRAVKHRRGLAHACGVSGWRRAALEVFREQGGQGEDAPRETSLGMLQLPAIHTGSIPSSATLEGAGAAFFRCLYSQITRAGKRLAQGLCPQQGMAPGGRSGLAVLMHCREVPTVAAPRARCCIRAKIRAVAPAHPGICHLRVIRWKPGEGVSFCASLGNGNHSLGKILWPSPVHHTHESGLSH